jgi:membrane protein
MGSSPFPSPRRRVALHSASEERILQLGPRVTRTWTLTWPELARRTLWATYEDNCLGLAAQLAYYFFLALFPALLFLLALASFFPSRLIDNLIGTLALVAPGDVLSIIRDQLTRIAAGEHGGLLTLGIVGAVWSSSAALGAMVDAMNQAYDVTETRAWWRVRLLAIVLTVVLALFILLSFTLVLVGPWAAEYLARHTGLGPAFEWTWKIAQWPVAFALTTVGMAVVNYFAPDVEQEWRWVFPGAILATVLWLATSLGFRAYVTHVTDYNATYGAVGGIIVLMLWFYLSGLSILIGAEMNAELEHASPEGKDPGERVAGGE